MNKTQLVKQKSKTCKPMKPKGTNNCVHKRQWTKKPTKMIDHPKNNTVKLKSKIFQRMRLSTSHFINQLRSFECTENIFHTKIAFATDSMCK